MAVELRTLRVTSDFNADSYVAGMNKKVAADRAGTESSKAAGQAVNDQAVKVASSVSVLEKLSRTYVEGYGAAARFNSEILKLAKSQDVAGTSVAHLEQVYAGMQSRFGLQANATELAARGYTGLAIAIENVNARLGVQAAAAERAGAATQRLVAANRNVPSGYTSNIAAQFQDIGVTAAMGMSPIQIALQQGTQLSSVFTELQRNGQSATRVLASAFGSLLSPISLVTLGVTAASVAAIQYFTSSRDAADGANTALATGNTLIRDAARAWGDALPNLKAYVDELDRAEQIAKGRDAGDLLAGRELDGLGEKLQGLNQQFSATIRGLRGIDADPAFVRDFGKAFGDLRTRLDDGTASTADYSNAQRALDDAVSRYGIPSVLSFRNAFDQITVSIRNSIEAARKARTEWISAIAGGTNVQDIVAGQTFQTGGKTYQTDRFTPQIGPTPQPRPLIELEGLPGQAKTIDATANAYRDVIKSGNDRIEQLRLEAAVAGQTGIAAERLRFEMDLLQEAQDKGRKVTPEQRAEIAKLGTAYEAAARQAASLKLQTDLQFEREQLGRTASDQQIASQLRGSGLPVDLGSYEAGLLRANDLLRQQKEAWEEIRDIGRDAIDKITGSAVNGFSDIEDTIKGIAQDLTKEIGQLAFANPLKNAIYGDQLPTMQSVGGAGGFVSALLGGRGPTSTGAMTVTAGTVMINGGPAGAINSLFGGAAKSNFSANTTLGQLLGGANDNVGKSDVASYIAQRAPKYGVDPSTALAVARSEGGLSSWNLQSGYYKNGLREQSFGPFQLYKGGGLGNQFMRETGLDPALAANGPAATDWSLKYASQNGWGSWYGAGKAGIGNWDGIDVNQSMKTASDAVTKLGSSAGLATGSVDTFGGGLGNLTPAVGSAAQGLNQFGSGVSTFGENLANMFPEAPSSGGGIFGKLIGGVLSSVLSSYGNSVLGSSPQFASAWKGGGVGLYAGGTDFAPGGFAVVGEEGPELVQLPTGSRVHTNAKTMQMMMGRPSSPTPANLNVKFNVINNTGSSVKTQRRDTNDGPQFDVLIDEAVASNLNTPGTRSRRAVKSQFGLSEGLSRR
ncbi:phage tail length tape measure family protein [Rhizobium ruizarguesonis]|uniref:phage tail length tape measure family protein n=1 Tax=Rhizobium ruizarguesonis TaxID=2081791 RepID=UPI0013E0E94E|nr:phage tail length tape measure family protein [Rhizobium ruizarguesonis]NEJ98556.1 phage tail tape measure protein [Rhizobium ruizarguesonis]